MFHDRKLYFTLVLLCLFIVCRAKRDPFDKRTSLESEVEYVDPHSFYYNKHTHTEVAPSNIQQIEYTGYISGSNDNGEQCSSCDKELRLCKISLRNRPSITDVADELLSRRLVNMILSRAKFINEDKLFSGLVELEATNRELAILREFGKGQLTLREIDSLLDKVIKTPELDHVYESALLISRFTSWMRSSMLFLWSYVWENKEISACIIFTLYMVYTLKKKRFNMCLILLYSMVIILILSFFITWWKLIQEAEIKHTVLQMKRMQMPVHCAPHKMSWWDKLTSWFSSTDACQEYFEAIMKIPFLQVTPAQAFSHMVAHAILEPIEQSGKALSTFLKHITADMHPFIGGIVRIFISVSFLPLLICCIILTAGGSFTIGGFGPASLFSLNGQSRSQHRRSRALESNTERRTIEIMLNIRTNTVPAEGGIAAVASTSSSNNRALKDKPKEKKTTDITEVCTSKSATNRAGGDCKLTHENSDAEDEPVVNVSIDGKECNEIRTNTVPAEGGIVAVASTSSSNNRALEGKPKEKKTTDITEVCTSKSATNRAGGDCKLTHENSDSEDEPVVNVSNDGKECNEVGSGDHASE